MKPLATADLEHLLPYSVNEPEILQYNSDGAEGAENLKNYIDNALKQRQNETERARKLIPEERRRLTLSRVGKLVVKTKNSKPGLMLKLQGRVISNYTLFVNLQLTQALLLNFPKNHVKISMSMKKLTLVCCAMLIGGIVTAQGKMWKKIREELVFENAPFKQCHASTLVQTETGELLLSFFGGSQEGKNDVSIWLCKLGDGIKADPVIVADGVVSDTLRYPAWNPVLFKANTGKLFLFYKVGPNPREWWGMVKTSNDNGITWSKPNRLAKGVLGPIKNKPVQLSDGRILSPSSTEENSGRWKAHIETSSDLGKTWKILQLDTSASFDVIQPSILCYKNKKLQILCRSKQGTVVQAWSYDNGKTWGPLSKTTLLNPNSGTDAVTLKSGKQLIVYNPDLPGKDWFNGRGKLRVACSSDGITWKDISILEDGTTEEYSYPAIIQTKDGLIHISYTFERKNIKHVVLKEGS